MNEEFEALYDVIESARQFMNQMNDIVAELHKEAGVNSGSRGVLLLLDKNGRLTSPQLAREMAVSRQYLQKNIRQMLAAGLIELLENPAHKKSSLVSLTNAGENTLQTLLKAEEDLLAAVELNVNLKSMQVTSQTLRNLTQSFNN